MELASNPDQVDSEYRTQQVEAHLYQLGGNEGLFWGTDT